MTMIAISLALVAVDTLDYQILVVVVVVAVVLPPPFTVPVRTPSWTGPLASV
jgi:hypothetical protein